MTRLHAAHAAVLLAGLLGSAPAARAAVFWGDVHAHSGLSDDATGSADNFFMVARDVVGLDFVVLSDHDIFVTDAEWQQLRQTAASFNVDGVFVAFSAIEWTHDWHMNVYYLGDDGRSCRSCAEAEDFYDVYGPFVADGTAAAHINHPLDPPYPVTWHEIDDLVTTNVEVWNAGSGDNEAGFGGALWALRAGFRLGFVGVSDDHHVDQRPLLMGTGITGCHADTLARADLLAALRARRCYATDGERIVLDLDVDGTPMGGSLTAPLGATVTVTVDVMGTDTPTVIEVLRNGTVVATKTDCTGPGCIFATPVEITEEQTFVYARVQQPAGRAWSSPVWVAGTCAAPGTCPSDRRARGGGPPARDCLAEWVIPSAPGAGRPTGRVACEDGDPTCDVGTTPEECTFRVGLCLGMSDQPRRACAPAAVTAFDLVRPAEDVPQGGPDFENRRTLLAALRALGAPPLADRCTPLLDLRVPVGVGRSGRPRPGRRPVVGVATAGRRRDQDRLTFTCRPSRS